MRDYLSDDDFGVTVSFNVEQRQFKDLEIAASLERIISSKQDTTWVIKEGGSVYATPLIHDGVVYSGACDSNFYALDAETGKELWRFHTEGVVLSSAAMDGDTVYFGSFDGNFYALSTGGELVWKFSAEDMVYSDPWVWGGRVYFGSHNGNVYAVDKGTGRLAWKFGTHGPVASSAIVHNGVVYIGSSDRNLYALDAETGGLRWKYPTNGMVRYRPAILGGNIVFGSLDGRVRAVNESGVLQWDFLTSDGIGTYMHVFDDVLYFGSRDGNWYAVDRNGRLLWKYHCKGAPNSVAVIGDVVYACFCENLIAAIDKRTGREIWAVPTNGWVIQMSVYEGNLYFGCWDCNMYSMTPGGKIRWRFHTSLSYQSALEPEEESGQKSFEVTWRFERERKEKAAKEEMGDYNKEFKSDYASSIGMDYLGFDRDEREQGRKKQRYR